jgi:hypothetical protein
LRFDLQVQVVTLLEGTIKLQQTDLRPHVCLGEESHGIEGVINIVGYLLGVDDLIVEDCRNLHLHIILGDRMLIGDIVYLFLQAMSVGDCVDEGQFELETRLADSVELAETLNDANILLFDGEEKV